MFKNCFGVFKKEKTENKNNKLNNREEDVDKRIYEYIINLICL
jgi:hypothetical protein